MPIQIQDIHDQEDIVDCPLCMEALEVDDINFFPCECGYQICRFCWHRIRTDGNGLCPACRKAYPENPAEFKPLTDQELQKIRQEKKQKEAARKQKITDSRKHLANVRVLQKNLVFVVGLSQRLADVEILKRPEYFGKYGKILKVVLNSNTSYAGSQSPSCSAYVTYSKMEESLRAIQSVNNVHIDGRTLKASLGTTKYCSNYLKNQVCQKHDCMYLHEIGDEDASFTKEDMQMAKHQEYEQKLIQQMIQKEIQQEMRAKATASRQEGSGENGEGSAGTSPPSAGGTITSGLSVAQAVKKNTKMAVESMPSNRPRRHSTSTPSGAPPDIQDTDVNGKISARSPKLSSSVGDKDSGGTRTANNSKTAARRVAVGKKVVPAQPNNQAPRHKKQQQLVTGTKKAPSRPESASPSSDSNSGISIPASVESSPTSTVVQNDIVTSVSGSLIQNGPRPGSSELLPSQPPAGFSDESLSNIRASALPIDIPISSDDQNRSTPHSDSTSSSVGRKSPFIRDGFMQEGSMAGTTASMDLNTLHNTSVTTKHRFMMLHKEASNNESISNGLGFSPFGMNPTQSSLLQDLRASDNGLTNTIPMSRVMPPPGLSAGKPANSGSWPVSNSRMPDSMPIQSSHDWEAAFGFKTTPSEPITSGDDDLGFDPWVECSKGLADLMEKEKTMESANEGTLNNQMRAGTMPYPNMTSHRRPTSLQNLNRQKSSQMGFTGGSDLVNGFSSLLSNTTQVYSQRKMPFPLEQSRFLPQQRLNTDHHPLLAQNNPTQTQGLLSPVGPVTPTKDQHGMKGGHNIQDMQNEFRALLPSVNINFANQSHTQRQSAGHNMDLSLGLSNLGMPSGVDASKPPISHPPGISNLPMQNNPFMNKSHIMPPPGVGYGNRSTLTHQHQWGGPDTSFAGPGLPSNPSNRLAGQSGLQSLFAGGNARPDSSIMPGGMSPYPPDPAIVQGGMHNFGPTPRRNRLFENSFGKTLVINSNNNSNEEQPHWMKSLHALTEPDSPASGATQTSSSSSLGQIFSQQRPNNSMPSWPNMSGLFTPNNGGYSNSQPPPGFQVRPPMTKATEFGALHGLLENQS